MPSRWKRSALPLAVATVSLGAAALLAWSAWVLHATGQISRLESASWHGDIGSARPAIEALAGTPLTGLLPPRLQARLFGLRGDLMMVSHRPEAAADLYGKEALLLLAVTDPAGIARRTRNPQEIFTIIAPAALPPALPPVEGFDASELTRHTPSGIPAGQNAHEALPGIPAILHGNELREIRNGGIDEFGDHAGRALELLGANARALAAYQDLLDTFGRYRCPESGEHLRLDLAANLFGVRFLAAWNAGDGQAATADHRRILQLARLLEDDQELMPLLSALAVRSMLLRQTRDILGDPLIATEAKAAMLGNLEDLGFNPACLDGVAAREFASYRARVLEGIDSVLEPGPGSLTRVPGFTAQWVREFDQELFGNFFRVHAALTGPGRDLNQNRPGPEAIFAEAIRAVRPAIYWRHPHAGLSGPEAVLLKTRAACRFSARLMAATALPDTGRIMETIAGIESGETKLLARLECPGCRTGFLEVGDARWIYPLQQLDPGVGRKIPLAGDELLGIAAGQIRRIGHQAASIVGFEQILK